MMGIPINGDMGFNTEHYAMGFQYMETQKSHASNEVIVWTQKKMKSSSEKIQ